MSKETGRRVPQGVRLAPFQMAFGETAKKTQRGIAIVNSEGILDKSDSKKPLKTSVEEVAISEAKRKRSERRKTVFAMHPEARSAFLSGIKKENTRRSREKLNLVKKVLGARSKKDLTAKLQSLYDELGTIRELMTWFEQRGSPVAHKTVVKILKSLGIEIKKARGKARVTPIIDEESRQVVLKAIRKFGGISGIVTPEQGEAIGLRLPENRDSALSLRAAAKTLKISYEAVRLREGRGIKRIKKFLKRRKTKPPVDS